MHLIRFVAAMAVLWSVAGGVSAQAWPSKPIKLVVPFASGGATDLAGRLVAQSLGAALGQPVVVDNRPGAGGNTGSDMLAKSPPDGYTLGTMSSTSYLVALQGRALPFDPIDGFSYVSYIGENLIGIAVRADSPWQTLADLVAVDVQKLDRVLARAEFALVELHQCRQSQRVHQDETAGCK